MNYFNGILFNFILFFKFYSLKCVHTVTVYDMMHIMDDKGNLTVYFKCNDKVKQIY